MPEVIFKIASILRGLILTGFKVFVAATLCAACLSCHTKEINEPATTSHKTGSKRQITDGFYDLFSNEPVKLNVGLQAIGPASNAPAFPQAAVERHIGTLRKYVNEERNARVPITLKKGVWKTKWKTDLPPSFTPSAVLETKDRIVLETEGIWFLFDRDGMEIVHGQLGASGVFLDATNFYAADATGMIYARRLSDGADVFGLSLAFGDADTRVFLVRKGQRFLAVSTERELDPDVPDTKERSLVELFDLGNPLKTDDDGVLSSAKALNHLARKTRLVLAATHGEMLVLGTQNRLYTADAELSISQALTGDFTPLAISLDEAGRIYAVVEKKDRPFLWIILPAGELAAECELASAFRRVAGPPIVGYDHRVYVLAEKEIVSFDQQGKLIWRTEFEGEVKGAVITADRQLVVTAGKELLAVDPEGTKRVLFDFGDQVLETAPAVADSGEILIASHTRLVKLAAD